MEPLALLLADGRMPTGGYAHSGGLEAAVADGPADVPAFMARAAAPRRPLPRRRCRRAGAPRGGLDALARLDAERAARTPSPAARDAAPAARRALLRWRAACGRRDASPPTRARRRHAAAGRARRRRRAPPACAAEAVAQLRSTTTPPPSPPPPRSCCRSTRPDARAGWPSWRRRWRAAGGAVAARAGRCPRRPRRCSTSPPPTTTNRGRALCQLNEHCGSASPARSAPARARWSPRSAARSRPSPARRRHQRHLHDEDARFLRRTGVLPAERIVAVQTGCCPHTAIRDDVSANLLAVEELEAARAARRRPRRERRRQPDRDLLPGARRRADLRARRRRRRRRPAQGRPGHRARRPAGHQQGRPRAARRLRRRADGPRRGRAPRRPAGRRDLRSAEDVAPIAGVAAGRARGVPRPRPPPLLAWKASPITTTAPTPTEPRS